MTIVTDPNVHTVAVKGTFGNYQVRLPIAFAIP